LTAGQQQSELLASVADEQIFLAGDGAPGGPGSFSAGPRRAAVAVVEILEVEL